MGKSEQNQYSIESVKLSTKIVHKC